MTPSNDSNHGQNEHNGSALDTGDLRLRYETGDALTRAGFGDVIVLSHDAADRALTPSRREIIDALATNEISSLRELADILDRNPGNLSRDLKVLVAEDIIRYEPSGKSKRPELKHDTIVQEPLLASERP